MVSFLCINGASWIECCILVHNFMFLCYNIGIEPWTFVQNLGDAVFIPAGCPHQVRNLKVK